MTRDVASPVHWCDVAAWQGSKLRLLIRGLFGTIVLLRDIMVRQARNVRSGRPIEAGSIGYLMDEIGYFNADFRSSAFPSCWIAIFIAV